MKSKTFLKRLGFTLAISAILFSCNKENDNVEHPDPSVNSIVDKINADSLEKNVQWLQSMGTRFCLANNRKEIAIKIKNRFIQLGYTNTTIDSFFITKTYSSKTYNTWQYNVIATIQGSTSPNTVCIMGGHYDDYSKNSDPFNTAPGANDNASGVAATLEVARVIHDNNFIPTTTIQFVAFAAEELGLFGSKDYASKLAASNSAVSMMLNSDMIACWPGSDPSLWTVNIMDYANSISLRENAQKICSIYTNLKTNNDNKYNTQSDSYSFYLNGYKAIFFESNAQDVSYHSTSDISSHCNFDYLKEVAKISCAMLIESNK